ncbi:MAG: M48 family metalloprotease [Sphingopyxis sp.]|nr:M48 family metalloprotease [Sphingopyxis sp.]
MVPASVTAQGRGTVQPFSEAERRQGAEAHSQIMQEFGGAYDGPQAAYVRSVGQNVAVQSGLSSARTDFTVTLLNSPVNNAFALPGGYVYATRQLMALMNNEAELAGVLGHEIGHTAARHSRQRQSRATRNSILGVLATVLGGAIGDNGGLLGGLGGFLQNNAMQAAQLATLSFSRSQETEADDLGIRYLNGAGYDPAALSTMLASLAAQNSLDARAAGRDARSVPEWASTHPDPASRVRRALDRARALNVANGRLNRDVFLNQINNVMYADDPRQGVIEGQDFIHPDLRLRFTAPQGFAMSNGTSAVAISGNSGQGQFSTAAYQGDLDAYVRSVFQRIAGENQQNVQLGPVSRTTINGLRAATASVRTTSGQRSTSGQAQQIDLTIVAYEFSPTQAFHFATITPAGQTGVFSPLYQSLRRISDTEARAVRPRRVQVLTVRRGDTVDSLAGRMAFTTLQRERFLVLNALTEGAALTPGQRVKIVVYATN